MGQSDLIAVNYQDKNLYQSDELKKILSQLQDYSEWNKKTINLDSILADNQISKPKEAIDHKYYQLAKSFNLSFETLDLHNPFSITA